jgi:hypothetical protein
MAQKRTLGDTAKDDIAKYVDEGEPLKDLGQKKTTLQGKPKPPKRKIDNSNKIKVTHYIRRDQVGALDRIRAKRLEAGAELKDVDKSSLMREAIDLLVKQEKV